MKRMMTLLLLMSIAVVSLSAQKALVIGNSGYTSRALPQPANDAALIDSTLVKNGWTVTKHLNLNAQALKTAVTQFGSALTEADMAIFHFSGAVVQLDGVNYLVPVGEFKDAANFKANAVDIGWVMTQLSQASVKLLFFDGARSPANLGFKLSKPGLASLTRLPANTMLVYGSPLDTVLVDTPTPNSHFSKAIAAEIVKPDLELTTLPAKISAATAILHGGKTPPLPWSASSIPEGWTLNPSGENMPRFRFRGVFKMDVDGGGSYSF